MQKNQSSEYIDPQEIQQLISKTARHTKHHYKQAIARYSVSPIKSREEKLFKRLAKEWSADRFKAARQAFWGMNQFQQRDFIEKMELHFDGR
jgi:predicted HicB family RNase H-like nuclease